MNDTAIIQHVLADLQGEFGADLIGLLVTGSRVRGEGNAHSDIDLIVVIDQARRQRCNLVVAGVEVEMFINPVAQIHRSFAQERASGRGSDQHMWINGQIVYNPRGVIAELQAEARTQWEAGLPMISAIERAWLHRYMLADAARDIADVVVLDPDRASYLIGLWLPQVVNLHYRINYRWLIKPKRVLNDLQTWDAIAADLARQATHGSVAARATALERLIEHVLAPLGGPMPLRWQSDWEEVKL